MGEYHGSDSSSSFVALSTTGKLKGWVALEGMELSEAIAFPSGKELP